MIFLLFFTVPGLFLPAFTERNPGSKCCRGRAVTEIRFDQPFTPPEVRPATKCFSMSRNRRITGMVAKMEVANRYCH